MITLQQLFIGRPHTEEQEKNAIELLDRVNSLLYEYTYQTGKELPINVHTGNLISGLTEGGFRLPECSLGAYNSAHKQGQAVDVYDPHELLDDWVTDEILVKFNLYREHPSKTEGWLHVSSRPTISGKRTFFP